MKLLVWFVLSLLLSISLAARGADLLDVYRLALLNDPTFEVARYTLKAAQEKYPQALAGLLPTVSASGEKNYSRSQNQYNHASAIDRNVHAWNWTLQLAQPLIRAQNFYAYSEAKIILEQAQAQYDLAAQEIILRVASAYFELLASRESILVAEAEIIATKEQLDIAKRGFEKGVVAITDVHDGQSRLYLARSHLVMARSEQDARDAELSRIIDEVPKKLAPLDHDVTIPFPEPNEQQAWINMARENHPAVRAAQFNLLATEVVVKKIRAEHTPTLDFVASYGENSSTGNTILPTDYASRGNVRQIGVEINVPLFSGGATSSRVSEAIANKYRSGAELEVARRQAATDARLAFAGVVNGLSQITALKSSVISSQSAIDGNRAGYKLGIYSNINVLNAEQQHFSAKRDLIKTRYETLLQAMKLKASAGILGEEDLFSANALLKQ